MKTVKWRKSFKKGYNRLNERQKDTWVKVYILFIKDSRSPCLRRHKVSGRYAGLESIDVMPDLRALFYEDDEHITFYYIANHNQLY
jgi:mRNA-degrading endonuclease YafQ of YafQ-DinJ toxin-antitoxin module